MTDDVLLVSVEEASRLMGSIDKDTVYALCNLPPGDPARLPHVRLGKRRLISLEGLRAWIKAHDGRDIFGGAA